HKSHHSTGNIAVASIDLVDAPLMSSRIREQRASKAMLEIQLIVASAEGSTLSRNVRDRSNWRSSMRRKMKARRRERPKMTRSMTRRDALRVIAVGSGMLLGLRSASGDVVEASAEISKFLGGASATPGRIAIGLPELAENGNSVPLSVIIDSPMAAE